jgi:hypothetical protein
MSASLFFALFAAATAGPWYRTSLRPHLTYFANWLKQLERANAAKRDAGKTGGTSPCHMQAAAGPRPHQLLRCCALWQLKSCSSATAAVLLKRHVHRLQPNFAHILRSLHIQRIVYKPVLFDAFSGSRS